MSIYENNLIFGISSLVIMGILLLLLLLPLPLWIWPILLTITFARFSFTSSYNRFFSSFSLSSRYCCYCCCQSECAPFQSNTWRNFFRSNHLKCLTEIKCGTKRSLFDSFLWEWEEEKKHTQKSTDAIVWCSVGNNIISTIGLEIFIQ